MEQIVSAVRTLVRPILTIGVVGAFIAGAFFDAGAADILKEITLVIVGFWFAERAVTRGGGGS